MARTNAKDSILSLFTDKSTNVEDKLSAVMVEGYLGYDRSTIDKHLLALVVDGKLDRNKEDGIYMYSLPNSITAVDNDAEVEPTEELTATTDANDLRGEKPIFFVRLNDIPGFTYGTGGHRMARAVAPFDKMYGRRFFTWGNTVTSLFVTDASINEISAAVQDACPEITFGIATTLDEAISIIEHYSTAHLIHVEGIKNTALDYFRWFGINLETASAPKALIAEPVPAKAEVATTVGITTVQPEPVVRDIYDIMEDISTGIDVSPAELKDALKTLAADWLENN